jgi:hypothetical protein
LVVTILKTQPKKLNGSTVFRTGITESARRAKEMILRVARLELRCRELSAIDFDFLFDKTQHLLAIGYNADEHRRDNSFYDLLASEARLASFIAIAQGKLPQQSWFALGRPTYECRHYADSFIMERVYV